MHSLGKVVDTTDTRPGPAPARLAAAACVALVAFAATAAVVRSAVPDEAWLPEAQRVKLAAFEAMAGEIDLVYAGSSHVQRSIIPEIVDARLAERGHPLRSFSFGLAGSFSFETDALLRTVFDEKPARVRFVVMNLGDWNPELSNPRTFRAMAWHDAKQTGDALRSSWTRKLSTRERLEFTWTHLTLGGMRMSALGSGTAAVREWMGDRGKFFDADVAKVTKSRGFLSLDDDIDERAIRRERRDNLLTEPDEFLGNVEKLARRGAEREADPALRVNVAALRDEIAFVRSRGIEPVYFVPAVARPLAHLRRLEERGEVPSLLEFNRPELYPELFELKHRFDQVHVNEAGARLFSVRLADALANLFEAREVIFTEGRFFAFLAVVWLVHWAMKNERARHLWLLAASLLFYGVCGVKFLALMTGTALIDWLAGVLLDRTDDARRRRTILVLSLVSNLGTLALFKYWDFFATEVAHAFGADPESVTLKVVLPVGISFYTFQSLSYTIDVYRRHLKAVYDPVRFLFFVSFFPQLVAGPIVRAVDFLPQLDTPRRLAMVRFRSCALLFLIGFVKKTCVADQVSETVDDVFAAAALHGAADLWLGSALYAIQIYCDFSGYSDMAIALAGLFGYQLTPNFAFPYLAQSVTDFWRRWHISLSTWFRDYLYIPLGGNRSGSARTAFNLALVFFLCGLWHGAAWTFVVWGAIHGAVLLVERQALPVIERVPRLLRHAWVLGIVLVAWVFFRAKTIGDAGDYLAGMFGAGGVETESLRPAWWLVVAAFAAAHVAMSRERLLPQALWTMPRWAFAVALGVAVALLLPWVSVGYEPFIYFQF